MKYKVWLIMMPLMLLAVLGLVDASIALNCQVATACSDAIIFKISNTKNAHAEIPSSTNYAYSVCCQGSGFTAGNSCGTGISVLKLSAVRTRILLLYNHGNELLPYTNCL